jgi:superoxide dismutase
LIRRTCDKKLEVVATGDADNPLRCVHNNSAFYTDMDAHPSVWLTRVLLLPNHQHRLGQGVPILTIDLWEHAFLLDVGIHREAYILNFFNIVNWPQVQKLYEGDLTLLLS